MTGIYDDDAVEVLFDEPFAEGTDLHGKARGRHGGMLPATQLLNLSKPQAVAATGVCTACADGVCVILVNASVWGQPIWQGMTLLQHGATATLWTHGQFPRAVAAHPEVRIRHGCWHHQSHTCTAAGAAAPRAVRKAKPAAQDTSSSPAAAPAAAAAASAAAAAAAAAAGRRQPPPAAHAAEAPHQNGVVQRQNGTAHGAAARLAAGPELLQRRGSAGSAAAGGSHLDAGTTICEERFISRMRPQPQRLRQTMRCSGCGGQAAEAGQRGAVLTAPVVGAGGLGGEAGSRPGSAPPSRTASPARLRPPSALAQPKGPQPKARRMPTEQRAP